MAITIRSTKGRALTHVEMDTNLTSYYVSSSISGTTLKLFSHGTGSFSAVTHSLDLSSFIDDTNTTYSISAETATGGANVRLTDSSAGTDDVKLASGTNVTVTRTDANTITISSQDTIYTHPSITATANTSTATPAHGGDFTVLDSVTVNSEGHVTAYNTKTVTLPADNNTEYTAGLGLDLTSQEFSLDTGSNHFTDGVRGKFSAGTNITITDGEIASSFTDTTYTSGTGIDIDVSNVISNTAPDQTVTLTGQNITVNGTYPNFQITGSDTSVDVTLNTTTYDYLSLSGQEITLGAIDLTTDVTGKLPSANIADIALTTVQTAADEATMLALTTQEGDVVVRTDESITYMRNSGTSGTMSDFTELSTPLSYTAGNGISVVGSSISLDTGSAHFTNGVRGKFTAGSNITITNGEIAASFTDNNTTYSISAETVTGGANLRLTDSGAGTDDVAIVGSGATTVTRTDANTITISSTDTDTVYTHPSITATANTSTASPSHGGTFDVIDSVTVNSEGHVTAYNTKTVTLPTDNDTTYTAGNGLGLNAGAFSLDTPSTLSVTSTNGVTADSHTHAITTTTNGTASTIVATDSNSEITAANFITTSDRRLKSEIEPIKDGLEVIKNIVSYEYIKNEQKEAGFIAQEVQEVLPYAVREGEDGYLKMTDRAILAHLNKAVQQLEERLSALEQKLG